MRRKKTLLTVVEALARQAARSAADKAEFVQAFTGRLRAMTQATDLVLSTGGRDATTLGALVDRQLGLHPKALCDRICVSGDAVPVRTEAAQQLSLIVHELSTNAVRYGALSVPTGRVDVCWTERDGNLVLEWTERGMPEAPGATRAGFGTTLITRAAPAQLGGTANSRFTLDGLEYRLEIPLTALLPPDHTATSEPPVLAFGAKAGPALGTPPRPSAA